MTVPLEGSRPGFYHENDPLDFDVTTEGTNIKIMNSDSNSPCCCQTTRPVSSGSNQGAPGSPACSRWWWLMGVDLHSAARRHCRSACVRVSVTPVLPRSVGRRPWWPHQGSVWGRLWPSCCVSSFCCVSVSILALATRVRKSFGWLRSWNHAVRVWSQYGHYWSPNGGI